MKDRKIISYMGNLYKDGFINHVREMKLKGFNEILFCITEADVKFNSSIFRDFLRYAKEQAMLPIATFWGYSAGEAIQKDLSFANWVSEVVKIGFKDIFIDEPKGFKLDEVCSFQFIFGDLCKFHLCLAEDTFRELSDETIEEFPVESVGISNYFWTDDLMIVSSDAYFKSLRLKELRPDDNFVFIQGFDISPGNEILPTIVKNSSINAGIKNFGFWSFRCTEATGCKRPINYKQIWASINFK